ncbi:helix-turn-helix domain-containing protein [Nocardioides sp.]|uniref:helix-turn-helix domain-containing protein n=1 Tax=Nocardioides sp. TaxID=35761 RepID=UPI003515C2DC
MTARGFTDGRSPTSVQPSYRRLADAIGIHQSTLKDNITGKRRPSPATIDKLVDALGEDVVNWLAVSRPSVWVPPEEAALLTARQRRALDELIRAMVGVTHRGEVRGDERDLSAEASPIQSRGTANLRTRSDPDQLDDADYRDDEHREGMSPLHRNSPGDDDRQVIDEAAQLRT